MDVNEKLRREARSVGLELVGKAVEGGAVYRAYRFSGCGHEQEIQTGNVRKNSLKCQTCFNLKLEQEAEAVGLELIGKAVEGDANYHVYRFNGCGHEQEIRTTHVRINNFKCRTCFTLKGIEHEAEKVGLTLIGKAVEGDKHYRLYRFDGCGHKQEIVTGHVQKNEFKCQTCQNLKLEQEAEAAGLELIGKAVEGNWAYRLYRFDGCGHEQEIQTSRVRKNGFKCQTCQNLKLEQEAEHFGLELIGKAVEGNFNYRLYRFDVCGHEQEICTGSVRINNFKCQTCLPGSSSGERAVICALESVNQPFIKEHTAKINGSNRRFDFFIDGRLLIEFDGKQHFQPTAFHSSQDPEDNLINIQIADAEKNRYAIENGLSLVRIHYTTHELGLTEQAVLESLKLPPQTAPLRAIPNAAGDGVEFVPLTQDWY